MTRFEISHLEWATTDLPGLEAFLSELFGWEFAAFGEGYRLSRLAGGLSVGLMHNPRAVLGGGSPNVYVQVADLAAMLERGQALGGSVAVPKTDIPGAGSFAFLKAPDGNLIGLQQAS